MNFNIRTFIVAFATLLNACLFGNLLGFLVTTILDAGMGWALGLGVIGFFAGLAAIFDCECDCDEETEGDDAPSN